MALTDGVGCWASVAKESPGAGRRAALFLDRDGVIVEERGYLRRLCDVALLPTAAATIAAFNAKDVPVVVVTNQSGIARGYLSWDDFVCVQDEVERLLRVARGAWLDAVFACAYHEQGDGSLADGDHHWCKPNPGMLLAAAGKLRLNLAKSWIAGDRSRDLAAGRAAGLAGGVHVSSGHGDLIERRDALMLAGENFQVRCAADLGGAAELLDALSEELAC